MEFIVIKDFVTPPKESRVLITKKGHYYYSLGVAVKSYQNWEENNDGIPVVKDTASIQIRVKAIHKNTKGYFYTKEGVRTYIDKKEERFIDTFMEVVKDSVVQ